jgi:acyl-CoA reductase-like NAD-dependent aldehyde dehydrogenase
MQEYKLLINGEWIAGNQRKAVRSPYDGAVIAEAHQASPREIEQALSAAEKAFQQIKKWPAHQVAEVLQKIKNTLAANLEDFAQTLSREAGKPIRTARVEVNRALHTFELGAEECKRICGEMIPLDQRAHGENRWGLVQRFPLGVITAITPFNFPLNLVAHKMSPSLASKNALILRPASQTPLCSLKLGAVALEAGWPGGALNVVPCPAENAEPLVTDPRVKMISFTGSPAVGWELRKKAYKKRVALELGGNAGVIVHDDANIANAVEAIANGGFLYAGQSCISVQRVFVHEKIFDELLGKLVQKAQAFVLGDPLDEKTDIGPMISEAEATRAEAWIREAAAAGAKILAGGQRSGTLLQPAILTNTKPEMKVNCQEIFGPMITVEKYSDFNAAVHAVDDSIYGLQAGVFTKDLERIRYAFENIEVGGLMVNEVPTWRIDHMPYGGVKESGNTREGVRYAIEEMTERRLLMVKF